MKRVKAKLSRADSSPRAVTDGSRSRLSWRAALVVLVLLLAGLAHLAYWYGPRERSATPRAPLVRAVLDDDSFDYRVWIPYPHQNLGRLSRVTGGDDFVAALWRLGGEGDAEAPSLPGFGPFRVPPARELAIAWSDAAEAESRLEVVARIYPSMAVVGRVAGWLAGNPWLRGGDVEVDGRAGQVRWIGLTWTLESPSGGEGGRRARPTPSGAAGEPPALLRFALARALGPVPAGEHQLLRTAGVHGFAAFELLPRGALGESAASAATKEARTILEQGNYLLALEASGTSTTDARALLVVETEVLAGRMSLPSAATLTAGSQRRFELPAESLARTLGVDLDEESVGSWRLVALDRASRARARQLLPEIELALEKALAGNPEVGLMVWLRPDLMAEMAATIADGLSAVPLVSRRERRRWRDWETVLRPWSDQEIAYLEVSADGQLRLEMGAAEALLATAGD